MSSVSLLRSLIAAPTNYFSYLIGVLARMQLPGWLSTLVIEQYVRCFGIDVGEIARELSGYRSLSEFFVRELKAEARPIEGQIVSPVDGAIVQFGEVEDGKMLQAKGKKFSAVDLVGDKELGERYRQGFYITFYLSPANYHHIHAPVRGTISDMYYLKGRLWPVTHWAVRNVSDLYVRNERVVSALATEGLGVVSVVAVGATNVGAIALAYDSLVTNNMERLTSRSCEVYHRHYSPGKAFEVGERLATFKMGSTVIVLFEKGRIKASMKCKRGPIKFGEVIADAC